MRISIHSCCCCWTTETPLTTFFSRVSIIPIPLDLLVKEKEIGIHRQFHPPITGYNKYRYSIHQLVDRPTGVFNRLLYRALYLLVKAIDIDRQFHIPIGQAIGIDRQFHVPIGHSNRFWSTMWHTYCKNNSLLCRFNRTYWSKEYVSKEYVSINGFTHLSQEQYLLHHFFRTYWSKQLVSIDKFAYLSKASIDIDTQYPQPIDIPMGVFNRPLSKVWYAVGGHVSWSMVAFSSVPGTGFGSVNGIGCTNGGNSIVFR